MGTALVMEHANALAQISGEHRLRVPSEESGNDYAGGNKRRDYGNTEVIKTAF